VKALFRRAKAHVGAWNPREAKEDFSKVMELDPSLIAACKKELRNIEDMEKQKDAEDREKLKKLF
jgi:AH receptor-interacting protein